MKNGNKILVDISSTSFDSISKRAYEKSQGIDFKDLQLIIKNVAKNFQVVPDSYFKEESSFTVKLVSVDDGKSYLLKVKSKEAYIKTEENRNKKTKKKKGSKKNKKK